MGKYKRFPNFCMTAYARVRAEAQGTMIIIRGGSDFRGPRSCPFSSVGIVMTSFQLCVSKRPHK